MRTTINLTFTKITFYDSLKEETTSMQVQGKLTVKESKEVIPTGTIFVTKAVEEDTFEVETVQLLALRLAEQTN